MPSIDPEHQGPSPKGNFRLATPEQREEWERCIRTVRRINEARPGKNKITVSTFMQHALHEFATMSDDEILKRLGLDQA